MPDTFPEPELIHICREITQVSRGRLALGQLSPDDRQAFTLAENVLWAARYDHREALTRAATILAQFAP